MRGRLEIAMKWAQLFPHFTHNLTTISGIKHRLRRAIRSEAGEVLLADPRLSGKFLPLPRTNGVSITASGAGDLTAVPPPERWEGYATTAEDYLYSGQKDVERMLEILNRANGSPLPLRHVLDLGCAAGRMLRFLPRDNSAEHWGLDINAEHISWCQSHLSPPMLFATNTTSSNLPFTSEYFDLVYCGSVFTHISELAVLWLLEVRRILRPGGYAYITIHTRHTLDLLLTTYRHRPMFEELAEMVILADMTHGLRSGAWSSIAIGVDPYSQVFYDIDQLRMHWGQIMSVVDVVEEAHDHQAAVVLRK
jgi:SAM-dependent methyltransferase